MFNLMQNLVDESEMKRAEFDKADGNHDGYIQFDEFMKVLEEEGADMTYRSVYVQGFRMADTDQDGKLSYDEVMTANDSESAVSAQ